MHLTRRAAVAGAAAFAAAPAMSAPSPLPISPDEWLRLEIQLRQLTHRMGWGHPGLVAATCVGLEVEAARHGRPFVESAFMEGYGTSCA